MNARSTTMPLTREELRQDSRLRTQTLGGVLAELTAEGRVIKAPAGYRLVDR